MEETAAQQACGKPIEIWFQDEARVGQKNKITRRWAKRGSRPSAPNDQRTASAYIFGAICPAEGKGAGLVLPSCNSEAMALRSGGMACLQEAVSFNRMGIPSISGCRSFAMTKARGPASFSVTALSSRVNFRGSLRERASSGLGMALAPVTLLFVGRQSDAWIQITGTSTESISAPPT